MEHKDEPKTHVYTPYEFTLEEVARFEGDVSSTFEKGRASLLIRENQEWVIDPDINSEELLKAFSYELGKFNAFTLAWKALANIDGLTDSQNDVLARNQSVILKLIGLEKTLNFDFELYRQACISETVAPSQDKENIQKLIKKLVTSLGILGRMRFAVDRDKHLFDPDAQKISDQNHEDNLEDLWIDIRRIDGKLRDTLFELYSALGGTRSKELLNIQPRSPKPIPKVASPEPSVDASSKEMAPFAREYERLQARIKVWEQIIVDTRVQDNKLSGFWMTTKEDELKQLQAILVEIKKQPDHESVAAFPKIFERLRLAVDFDDKNPGKADLKDNEDKVYDKSAHEANLKQLIADANVLKGMGSPFWNTMSIGLCCFTVLALAAGGILSIPLGGPAMLPALMAWAGPVTSGIAALTGLAATGVGAAALTAAILPSVTGSVGVAGFYASRTTGQAKALNKFVATQDKKVKETKAPEEAAKPEMKR